MIVTFSIKLKVEILNHMIIRSKILLDFVRSSLQPLMREFRKSLEYMKRISELLEQGRLNVGLSHEMGLGTIKL